MDGNRGTEHSQYGVGKYIQSIVCLTLVLGISWVLATPARADEPLPNQALFLLVPGADISTAIDAIHLSGGHVTHVFPPAALIGEVPTDEPTPPGILAIHRQAVDEATLTTLTGEARRAAQVWNALLNPEMPSDAVQLSNDLEAELVNDALVAPFPEELAALAGDPIPDYYQTSEYLIGRVAVGIILPESDGSVDPSSEDWTEAERTLVLSEISAALNWWAAREPNAHLTFVYDDGTAAPVTTSYEPISRRYGDQSLWITEVMTKKGYTGSSYFDQVRGYNNALREVYNTDWAFTIFVVDSTNDSDNRFSDGYFAYAYLGGPFTVMTYGNNGYGPYNMDAVAAHEMGHIFLALDQYYSAYQSCTRVSGYLGVENQNSQYGSCASNVTSIMRGQVWPYGEGAVDEYARGQVGWRDSDGDGILDPVDTTLSIVGADYVTDPERPNVLTFTGGVEDSPYPSPFRRSTLINTIEQVQYRVAGGKWTDAQPADGAFDTYAETFIFTTPPLPTGDQTVEMRVSDSAGNQLIQAIDTVSVVDPVDDILDTSLTRLGQHSEGGEVTQIIYSGQGISSTSYVAGVYYRIDDAPWQPIAADDGAFDEPLEDFSLTIDLTALSPGVHEVQAYSVDGAGNVESSPAVDSIFVQAPTYVILLPLLMFSQ
jgi:hypothetical protein